LLLLLLDAATVLMCQWFAPTRLVVTFETEGEGRWTPEELAHVVVRDSAGSVVALELPKKSVIVANHQVPALCTPRCQRVDFES
jgi:hypothetical protein